MDKRNVESTKVLVEEVWKNMAWGAKVNTLLGLSTANARKKTFPSFVLM